MSAIQLSKRTDAAEVADIELFAIDGQSYTVPAKPRVNIALRYLRNVRKIGVALAESALLEELLGPEGFEALCDFEDLRPEDLKAISEAAATLALGALEEAEGNGEGESRKSAG